MRISCFAVLLFLGVLNSFGQQGVGSANSKNPKSKQSESSAYSIIQEDANSRVWAHTNYEKLPSGELVPQVRTYTELGTGLNYRQGNEWKESEERVEPQAIGGGAALMGQHKVYFPYDIYQGVIETVTPEGTHLKSRPLGISYFDGTNSILIAELTNSIGQILASGNQVIYTNAFTDFAADLLVTYRKGGMECDLIVREQPPGPESFGLNPETSRLEMLTEFFDTPEPKLKATKVNPHSGLEDSAIEFGSMQMIEGKAFVLGDGNGAQPNVPVAKTWAHLDGRTFLVEEVPVAEVKPQLQLLPVSTHGNSATPGRGRRTVSLARQLPAQRLAAVNTNAVQMAKANVADKPGFALDYNMVVAQTNFTFQGDTTYYVRDPVNLSGTTTIEGNTVIKCVTNIGAAINILGTLNCATAPYRPAVITSSQDSTVGETIPAPIGAATSSYYLYVTNTSGNGGGYFWGDVNGVSFNQDYYNGDYLSTGQWRYYAINLSYSSSLNFTFYGDDGGGNYLTVTPQKRDGGLNIYEYYSPTWTLTYGETGASLGSPAVATGLSLANGGVLHDLRFCNLTVGVSSSTNYSITNAQFVNCGTALQSQNATLFAGNILMNNVKIALAGQSYQATVEHLTYDQGTLVTTNTSGSSSVTLINSLITGVSSYGNVSVATNTVAKVSSSAGIYQTVGGGSHYLGTNIYRGVGTNLDAGMAAQLAQRTTYPPTAYTNVTFTNAMTFPLQAPRDTNTAPDLGYHYDPLDYTFGGCSANSNVTFNAGVAAGWFRTTSGTFHAGYGLHPTNGVTVTFNGAVTAPDYWVRLNTVQDQDTTAGTGTAGIDGWATNAATAPVLQGTFLRASTMASESGSHFGYTDGYINAQLTHSELWSGSVGGGVGNFGPSLNMTNSLADRCLVTAYGTNASIVMRNITMRGGNFIVNHLGASAWPADLSDCAFDGTTISVNAGGNTNLIHYAYNAYRTNANRLTPTNITDVVVTNFNWQTGLLGRYYLPASSTLINKGHTNAGLVGLYHFTTQTNQLKETNTVVDIGYHYVALNVAGMAIDTDADGLPDYLEDVNGNGLTDSGETSFTAWDTDGDGLSDAEEAKILLDADNPSLGYLNPLQADTGGTGIPDGQKDSDHDGISNLGELRNYGSNPSSAHTFNLAKTDAEYFFTAKGGESNTKTLLSISPPVGGIFTFSISGGIANGAYDIYYANNILVPKSQYRRVYTGVQCDSTGHATFSLEQPDFSQGYFVALSALDTDQDGLPDGYEAWFSYSGKHTIMDNVDSDLDGMYDAWEVEYGLNPTVAVADDGKFGNADGDSYYNLQEFQIGAGQNGSYDPLKAYGTAANRPVVSISTPSLNPVCQQSSFKITRDVGNGGSYDSPLTVYYSVGGSLSYDRGDYSLSPAPAEWPRIYSATIPAANLSAGIDGHSVTITVNASGVSPNPGDVKTLIVSLTPYSVSPNPQVLDKYSWAYVLDWSQNRATNIFDNQYLRPTALGQNAQTCPGVPKQITLQGNPACGQSITFRIVSSPSGGGVSAITPNPSDPHQAFVTYTPRSAPLFCGRDSFAFEVNDGLRDSAPATVIVDVGDPNLSVSPQIAKMMVGKNSATPVALTLTGSDICGDTLTFAAIPGGPQHGTLTVNPINANQASVSYKPNSGFRGTDGFLMAANNCGFDAQDPSEITVFVVGGPVVTATCDPLESSAGVLLKWDLDTAEQQMNNAGLVPKDYKIYRSSTAGGPYTLIYTTPDGSQKKYWDNTGVIAGHVYYYVITFEFQDGSRVYESPYSTEIAATATQAANLVNPNSYWDVTDITDVNNPVNLGSLQGPFGYYPGDPYQYAAHHSTQPPLVPVNNLWTDCNRWSNHITLDLTGYSSAQLAQVTYSIALDNSYSMSVNNQTVVDSLSFGGATWSQFQTLPHLVAGLNHIGVIIFGDCDDESYFSMVISPNSCDSP